MLFSAEPLISERFENLIGLTLTATALKFTLADHMPAEGSLTMLDQVMFFVVFLITMAGVETWILDTLVNHWFFDDHLVGQLNFYTAIGFCGATACFAAQHVVTLFMIRGKNQLEMLRVDSEWIVSGGDDSMNMYKTPNDNFEVGRNNLVLSPKVQLLRTYQDLFAHKQWENEAKQIFSWLDSERNQKLAGNEMFDFVLLFATIFSGCVDRDFEDEDLIDEYFDNFGIRNSSHTLKEERARIVIKTLMPLLKIVSTEKENGFGGALIRAMRWYENGHFEPVSSRYKSSENATKDFKHAVAKKLYMKFLQVLARNFMEIYVDMLTKKQHDRIVKYLQRETSGVKVNKRIRRHVSHTTLGNISPRLHHKLSSSQSSLRDPKRPFALGNMKSTRVPVRQNVVSIIADQLRRHSRDKSKLKELMCRIFFDMIEETPCFSKFLPVRGLNKVSYFFL